ncbi:MAG: hypothetical protein E7318_13350, partial [Clostridiales bacterium]|nr:hypothetical protein [Clostridiales bacterium]
EDGTVILKAVNPTDNAIPADVTLPDGLTGEVAATILTGHPEDVNSIAAPDKVAPVTRVGRVVNGQLNWTFDPWSVNVLMIKAE